MPQLRVAIHVDGASPHQAGILDIVKNNQSSRWPAAGRRRRRGVIRVLAGPPNQRARVNVQLDVALHQHSAGQVNAGRKKEHAASGPGRDVANGAINYRRFEGLAHAVNLVVLDVDDVRIAESGWILFGRFGKQHQPGGVEGRLVVEEQQQVAWPIQIETDRIPADLRLDAISQRPYVAGEHLPLADQQGYRDVDLPGHRETGVIHPVELVVSQEVMHEHRLTVDRDLISHARHRARVRRVGRDRGEGCRRQEHQKQSNRARRSH